MKIKTNIRNEIVNEVRSLLDKDFTKIIIYVEESGFSIIPTKEVTSEKVENGK